MTPSQKRRAKRRKSLQRKGPAEVQHVIRVHGRSATRYDVLQDLFAKRLAEAK